MTLRTTLCGSKTSSKDRRSTTSGRQIIKVLIHLWHNRLDDLVPYESTGQACHLAGWLPPFHMDEPGPVLPCRHLGEWARGQHSLSFPHAFFKQSMCIPPLRLPGITELGRGKVPALLSTKHVEERPRSDTAHLVPHILT